MPARLPVTSKSTVFYLHKKGFSSASISKHLWTQSGIRFSSRGVRFLIKRGESARKPRERSLFGTFNKRRKLLPIHFKFIDLWMIENNNLSSNEITAKLETEFNVKVSSRCALNYRTLLGWSGKHKKYCQLINNKNTSVRFNFAVQMLATRETFSNVIFTDETTVEMSSTGRLSFYKIGQSMARVPRKAPKPKHSYKVHVWAGISYRGRTHCCIFSGIMDSVTYQLILRDNLLPFTREVFPDGYRLYQDNDSKHKSKSTMKWMEENGVRESLMESPASSPDLNPIENVWATMKDYIQRTVKPKKKDELVDGIKQYWESLTPAKCAKFIDHIHKVLPVVVLNEGGSTEF